MGLLDLIEARRLERERAIRNEKAIDAVKIIASVGVGFALGLLFAPKSGKKTREDISNSAKKGLDFVTKNIDNTIKVIKEKNTELKESIAEKTETIPALFPLFAHCLFSRLLHRRRHSCFSPIAF